MGKLILEGEFWQVFKYEWGEIELKVLGNPLDKNPKFIPVASLENLEDREGIIFYNDSIRALKSMSKEDYSQLCRKRISGRGNSAHRTWRKIRERYNLSEKYDVSNLKCV